MELLGLCVCGWGGGGRGQGGIPGESIELWEGADTPLTGKSRASVVSGLFLGSKYLTDASPH